MLQFYIQGQELVYIPSSSSYTCYNFIYKVRNQSTFRAVPVTHARILYTRSGTSLHSEQFQLHMLQFYIQCQEPVYILSSSSYTCYNFIYKARNQSTFRAVPVTHATILYTRSGTSLHSEQFQLHMLQF